VRDQLLSSRDLIMSSPFVKLCGEFRSSSWEDGSSPEQGTWGYLGDINNTCFLNDEYSDYTFIVTPRYRHQSGSRQNRNRVHRTRVPPAKRHRMLISNVHDPAGQVESQSGAEPVFREIKVRFIRLLRSSILNADADIFPAVISSSRRLWIWKRNTRVN